MKVEDSSPTRLVISAPRHQNAHAMILGIGGLGFIGLAVAAFSGGLIAFAIGAIFLAIAVAGYFYEADTLFVFDAVEEILTVERHRRLGIKRKTIPFKDILAVTEVETEAGHTVNLRLVSKEAIPLETSYAENAEAAEMASIIQSWLNAHQQGKKSSAT